MNPASPPPPTPTPQQHAPALTTTAPGEENTQHPAYEYSDDDDDDDRPEVWKSGTRTPRPYHRDGVAIRQDGGRGRAERVHRGGDVGAAPGGLDGAAAERGSGSEEDDGTGGEDGGGAGDGEGEGEDGGERRAWGERDVAPSVTGSESGTEADDEQDRPGGFVKALPAPEGRPRKGLRTGEEGEDALLTPSQLDDEGRPLLGVREGGYFDRQKEGRRGEDEAELGKIARRRRAEFARRTSEVGVVAVIGGCVACGPGVLGVVVDWWRELAAHVLVMVALVLVYPVKLSIVDAASPARKLWQRFRVPASFDPATVLYPPLLPVLVALSVAPANRAAVLPNTILGLSALPQRLFPRSSRLGVLNEFQWLVSILPLIVAQHTSWPSKGASSPFNDFFGSSTGLSPEILVSLYPLHHTLLQPLTFLTTTSLLISELHLLATALINLLLLADSPQMNILKACLWVGGVPLFIVLAPILHWNVTLIRVPRWKLRRPGHTAEERKSLVDAASDVINVQRAMSALKPEGTEDSDADEDHPAVSIKQPTNGSVKAKLDTQPATSRRSAEIEPTSATEQRSILTAALPNPLSTARPRRSATLPTRAAPSLQPRPHSTRRSKPRSPNLLWCLHLTPTQAQRRKHLYALYTTLALLATILLPIRLYVQHRALHGHEPIGWAISYLLGHLPFIRTLTTALNLQTWIPLPAHLTTPPPSTTRLVLLPYWLLTLLLALLTLLPLSIYNLAETDTRRKVFHALMVALLLPTTYLDPPYISLALALVLALFLALEALRAGQIEPLGRAIANVVAPYVDGRDLRGPVVVSHIFLLVGCAVPLWFSLASLPRNAPALLPDGSVDPETGWAVAGAQREVAMTAGVVCVGLGDAAASLVGRRFGRHKWVWVGGKSLEGSAAFAGAVTVGLVGAKVWLVWGGWADVNGGVLGPGAWGWVVGKVAVCACGASFVEAVLTGANDNVVVPVVLWLMVKGLGV